MEKTFEIKINEIVYAVTACMATAACDNEPQEALRVTARTESGEIMMHNVFGWKMPETAEDFMDMCKDYNAWEEIEQG